MNILKSAYSTALFSAVINILMLTGPLFMLQVYDRVLASASVPTLVALITIVAGLYGFMAILEWIRGRVLARDARRWDEEISGDLFKAVLTDDRFATTSGRTFSPLRDLDTVRNFLAGVGPRTMLDLPWVPFYIAVIFMLHSLLGWFAVAAAALLVVLMIGARLLTKYPQSEASALQEASHSIAQEALGASDAVRALALSAGLGHKWQQMHARALSLQERASDRAGLFSGITKSARLFFQAGILAVGAVLAIQHEVSAGAIVAASIILSRGLAPIEQMIGQWQLFTSAHAAWRRLAAIAGEEAAPKTLLPAPQGHLSVKNLSCFLPDSPVPLLKNVNFELQPGELLGITGPSAVGKSTLLKAMLGIWPNTQGEVRLDGATLDQWDREELSRYLGYVPQEIALFSGTVAQNISRFLPDATSAKIVEAARLAQAHEMILKLPLGYDTPIGAGGIVLSAGQRQRIALASALYGRPRLIVLDEPNSNLDEVGEQALIKAISTMRKLGSTIIIATHRRAALADAGKLLALREGRQAALAMSQPASASAPVALPTLQASGAGA
jgi:PrtD family type I secretion system ABC transporter